MDQREWQRMPSGKAPPKRRRNIEQLTKSYVDLVAEAISSTSTKTMTVSDICDYLKTLYGSGKSETTLKNTVRHTLSCYNIFKKIRKEEYNRPALWTVRQQEYYQIDHLTSSSHDEEPSTSAEFAPRAKPSTSEPVTGCKLSRAISISCPVSLTEYAEGGDFLEPSAARYSIPVALDRI